MAWIKHHVGVRVSAAGLPVVRLVTIPALANSSTSVSKLDTLGLPFAQLQELFPAARACSGSSGAVLPFQWWCCTTRLQGILCSVIRRRNQGGGVLLCLSKFPPASTQISHADALWCCWALWLRPRRDRPSRYPAGAGRWRGHPPCSASSPGHWWQRPLQIGKRGGRRVRPGRCSRPVDGGDSCTD